MDEFAQKQKLLKSYKRNKFKYHLGTLSLFIPITVGLYGLKYEAMIRKIPIGYQFLFLFIVYKGICSSFIHLDSIRNFKE